MELLPDRVASVLSSIGSKQFGKSLLGLFDSEFELTYCAAFERDGAGEPPRVILADGLQADVHATSLELATQWMASDYKDDPFLADIEVHARSVPNVYYADVPSACGCVGMRARLVEQYYDRLNIGEEATYTVRDGEKLLSVSLYKERGSSPFSVAERATLSQLSGLMLQSAQRHGQLLAVGDVPSPEPVAKLDVGIPADWAETRADKLARLRSVLVMDSCRLTLREAEICAYIVMGYTVFAISLLLGISTNTVATHRKRAYSKLGLSSQTELFNVCLKHFL